MKEDIMTIAALSRRACEAYVEVHGGFWKHLGGMCGLASHFLFCNLERAGYKPIFIMASLSMNRCSHCWVYVDGIHIDLTASQFNTFLRSYAPLYTFKGKAEDHPVMKKYFAFVDGYPDAWNIKTANNEDNVERLMIEWGEAESFVGLTRKRLNNLYKG